MEFLTPPKKIREKKRVCAKYLITYLKSTCKYAGIQHKVLERDSPLKFPASLYYVHTVDCFADPTPILDSAQTEILWHFCST